MRVEARTTCRSCGSDKLFSVLSLGEQYISAFVEDEAENSVLSKAPLELVICDQHRGGCGLVQLKHTVPADLMFKQYWYRSSINSSMTLALQDIAASIERTIKLAKDDIVVDIGCNDGTLLRSYRTPGIARVGFEPATNLIPYATRGTNRIINDYFTAKSYTKNFSTHKAKAITSIAMFYDLEQPNEFTQDVADCLDDSGVWVIQMSYLPSMLTQNAFDNICHEHLEYYSLAALRGLLERRDLEVFDVELNDVNGGSFRVYVKHHGCNSMGNDDSREHLSRIEKLETEMKLDETGVYAEFASRVKALRGQLLEFIKAEHKAGRKIYVYGASTKGNTLLQYCNLDNKLITAAAERNSDKWGKKTVGTLIPIISEEQARAEKPDYFLVLPWHFLQEFIEREHAYLKSGGKFIVPLPEFRII